MGIEDNWNDVILYNVEFTKKNMPYHIRKTIVFYDNPNVEDVRSMVMNKFSNIETIRYIEELGIGLLVKE